MSVKNMMLIADDLDINRDVLREMFQSEFEVIEAQDGRECINLVKQYETRIKIVLLDMMMPVMSGLDVLKYRKTDEIFSKIPVIVITVNDEIRQQMNAFDLGATDYITKPFIREIVIYRINNVLFSKKRVDEIMREKETFQVRSELDLMTGLYNKTTVEALITSKLKANSRLNALIVIDIDNFKQVNDCLGHLIGDHTIRIIADLISGHFRKTDLIGRVGGDEFIVFMDDLPSPDIARRKADDLTSLLRYKPNITMPANVSISIGLVISETRPYTYEELFEQADHALYQAKENGKGQYAEYGISGMVESSNLGRGVVLLFSRNKDVCGVIRMVNKGIQLVESLSPEDARFLCEKYSPGIRLLYADISLEPDNGESVLNQLQEVEILRHVPIIAICREGDMHQYAAALEAGARDILPSPLDITFVKRRTQVLLDTVGIRD